MIIDFKNLESLPQYSASAFEKKVLEFIEEWISDSKLISVQTSGSTGRAKIFNVEKSKMSHSAKMTCDFLGLEEGLSALICLPIEYISGKMMVVRSLERKLKLSVVEPSTKPLENLNQEIDFCAMTPLQVENSLDKIHFIKKLIIGGAEVSAHLRNQLFLKLQTRNSEQKIYETYGMSETLSHIALKEIFPKNEDFFSILNGIEISLDERGCLRISAPKLNSEILQTNDLVELKNEKQFRFLGRIDNVINSGGAKIFPEELEHFVKKQLQNFDRIPELVFLGIPDRALGRKLVLAIESQEDESLKSIIWSIEFQKSFQKPKDIFFIEKIPRTPNGKIDRLQLISELINL